MTNTTETKAHRIQRALVEAAGAALTARELAELVGCSASWARRVLRRLEVANCDLASSTGRATCDRRDAAGFVTRANQWRSTAPGRRAFYAEEEAARLASIEAATDRLDFVALANRVERAPLAEQFETYTSDDLSFDFAA